MSRRNETILRDTRSCLTLVIWALETRCPRELEFSGNLSLGNKRLRLSTSHMGTRLPGRELMQTTCHPIFWDRLSAEITTRYHNGRYCLIIYTSCRVSKPYPHARTWKMDLGESLDLCLSFQCGHTESVSFFSDFYYYLLVSLAHQGWTATYYYWNYQGQALTNNDPDNK